MPDRKQIDPKRYKQGKAIVTNNPKDPRLKAYNDSLSLYNHGEKERGAIMSKDFSREKWVDFTSKTPKPTTENSILPNARLSRSYKDGTGLEAGAYTYKKPTTPVTYEKPVSKQTMPAAPEKPAVKQSIPTKAETIVTAKKIDPIKYKKIYTDKAQFDKANKAYGDSLQESQFTDKWKDRLKLSAEGHNAKLVQVEGKTSNDRSFGTPSKSDKEGAKKNLADLKGENGRATYSKNDTDKPERIERYAEVDQKGRVNGITDVPVYKAPREIPVYADPKKYKTAKVKLYPSGTVEKSTIDSLHKAGRSKLIGEPMKMEGQVAMYGPDASDKIKRLIKRR